MYKTFFVNLSQRMIYCALVVSGGIVLYWLLNQIFNIYPDFANPVSLLLQEIDFIDKWLVISIILVSYILTELGSIAYSMYKTWKLPRIIEEGKNDEEKRYYKVTGREGKPTSREPASRSEILAYVNMIIIRKKLNFDDSLVTTLLVEEDNIDEKDTNAENLKRIWSNVRAYTLGIETPVGGKHGLPQDQRTPG